MLVGVKRSEDGKIIYLVTNILDLSAHQIA